MVAGHSVSPGSARSSASSTTARRAAIQPASAAAEAGSARGLVTRRLEGRGHEIAAGVLQQQLDLALRLLELGVAHPRQPHALLVQGQRLLERELALLQ